MFGWDSRNLECNFKTKLNAKKFLKSPKSYKNRRRFDATTRNCVFLPCNCVFLPSVKKLFIFKINDSDSETVQKYKIVL